MLSEAEHEQETTSRPPRPLVRAGAADDPVHIGTPIGTSNKESTGKVFEKVIGIVLDSTNNNNPNSATIIPAPIPTSAITDPNARACLQANDIHNRCTAQTPGFDAISYSSQASCLCYGTTSGVIGWQGQSYGGLVSSCYSYVSGQAGQTTSASGVSDQAGLCGSVGDVRQSAANDAALSSFYATENSAATSTGVAVPASSGGAAQLRKNGGAVILLSVGLLWGRAVS